MQHRVSKGRTWDYVHRCSGRRTDERTKQTKEQTNERKNEERRNEGMKKRETEERIEGTGNGGTKERRNEGTEERRNGGTKKRQRTNQRIPA